MYCNALGAILFLIAAGEPTTFSESAETVPLGESGARVYGRGQTQRPDPPLRLTPGPHLFIDDYYFETIENARRVVNAPERDPKIPNPIVTGKEDGCFQPYLTVLRDAASGRRRMWFGRRTEQADTSRSRLGYIESADGVNWERPVRVLDDPAPIQFGVGVVDDGPGCANSAQRYKYAWWFDGGLRIATSPDGLSWTPLSPDAAIRHNHDITGLFRDPLRDRYTATVSVYRPGESWAGDRRVTMHSHSADLIHWSRPRYVVLPDTAVDEGQTQFYAMDGYLARGGLLIGMVKVLRDDLKADDPSDPPDAYGIGYTSLAWSRDGETWTRDPEHFFDPDPKKGAWDHAHAWIDEQVLAGNDLFLYYGGYARGHKVNRFEERQIGLVKLPRDRYAGWAAGSQPARIVTAPLAMEGSVLAVNADARGGSLRVQVLDSDGKPVPDFTFDDVAPLTTDTVAGVLRWKRPLSDLEGRVVRLEFAIENATLYSVESFENARDAVDAAMPVARWEEHIRKIEQRQIEKPSPRGGIVFAGSSTIVGWNLPKFFPDLDVVNCGFGGSHMHDSVYYADRIIMPLAPRIIVVYAGDNDISFGLLPEDVAEDFKAFTKKIHETLPKTRILYLSIKPSIARWEKWPIMKETNSLIEAYTQTDPRLEFVDMTAISLDKDGQPRPDFLQKDGLHFNDRGYRAWTDLLAPRFESPAPK